MQKAWVELSGRRGTGHKIEHRKYFFDVQVAEPLAQTAQRSCRVFLEIFCLGKVLDTLLCVALLEQGIGSNDLQRSLPTSNNPRFYDFILISVKKDTSLKIRELLYGSDSFLCVPLFLLQQ